MPLAIDLKKMEVVVPSPSGSSPMDHFDFNHGARISPYLTAPSSPKRFGEYYLSAPTSPSRVSEFYAEFEYFSISPSTNRDGKGDDGFAFSVSGESQKSSRSAEELFDGGKIKPLKEDDELLESSRSPLLSPKQPKGKKAIREALSPRKKKESGDPFGTESEERRGRDRTPSSKSGRRVTRSHSPYRTWDQQPQSNKEDSNSNRAPKSSRKWRLRDLLLFRSASEGRGTSTKYPVSLLFKKPEEGKARSRRKEPASAHELHYARKKAETEDLKKRTFLPYKQGILGRLAGFTR